MCDPPLASTIEWVSEMQEKYGIPGTGNLWVDFLTPRILDGAEVAAFVVWLCTDAAANITGCTFQIGAGQVALYSEPDLGRSAFRKEGWNLEELDALGASRYLTSDIRNPYSKSDK
jgi:hypothetical protein